MQTAIVATKGSDWSVFSIFGEDTIKQRPKFGGLHYTKRRKFDRMNLQSLKQYWRETDCPLEKEYISQNVQIIQLSRGVIS